ncbi:MAG: winged helix-turn-helix transcriptional regulator [archaeon]
MKLTSRQTYKIVTYVLATPKFTQTKLAEKTGVSWGRMNEIVQWLVSKGFVEKRIGNYELIDPANLVSLFPIYRDMTSLLLEKLPLRLTKKQVLEMLPKKAVLCLDSALEFYSGYWNSGSVYAYADNKQLKEIENKFKPWVGGNTNLFVFKPDMPLETKKVKGFIATSRLRTLIDMLCDKKSHSAKDLYKQLWGLKFEE